MRFLLAPIYDPGGPARTLTLEVWERTIVPQILDYMASPSSYPGRRTAAARRFPAPLHGPDTYAAGYAVLRRAAVRRLGVEPFILNLLGGRSTAHDLAFRRNKLRPDGFTCFSMPVNGVPQQSYPDYARQFVPAVQRMAGVGDGARDPSLVFVPCGSIGQDARPWYRIEYRLDAGQRPGGAGIAILHHPPDAGGIRPPP